MREPSSNALFPELLQELRRLEQALLPDRLPSSTITINRNAQFKPHKDSGAGNGQVRGCTLELDALQPHLCVNTHQMLYPYLACRCYIGT